jgi:hypothetical protein
VHLRNLWIDLSSLSSRVRGFPNGLPERRERPKGAKHGKRLLQLGVLGALGAE